MNRWAWFYISLPLVGIGAALLSMNGCGAGSTTVTVPPATVSKIQHVVIIFQENRTPDNLFQDPVLISHGADIASSGLNSLNQTIPLTPIDLGNSSSGAANPDNYDLSHAHSAFVEMCNLNAATGVCAMNGADLITPSCAKGVTNCWPANPQFKYVNRADVAPYFQMAEKYTFADRMFQTNQGPSFPAHQFIISGTSAPSAAPSAGSNLFVSENPGGVTDAGSNTGCTAPPAEYVKLIDPAGNESSTMYPCFEHPTLTDLLNTAKITWRYYAPSAGSIWTAPNAIQHMCGVPYSTACTASDWVNNVVLATTQAPAPILNDIANGKLATVSWVIPDGAESDHALGNDGSGPSWVSSIVNAIGNSSYWSNTAIIITWDDWGGWYDHVAPTILNSYEYGFRVPMIVVSPYAKPAYISHVTHDFGSILKFVETNFDLPSLGYADAVGDDLSDCFNYSQTPISFQTINAPMRANYFLNDRRPLSDPDDD
jgi:phospholipase C